MLRFSMLSLGAIALAGCAVRPADDFSDVQRDVRARTGQSVRWNTSSDDDQSAERAVRDLLDKPLTRESAVQVALLNNPSLQATFEEIGIAQADLVQAGLLANPVFDGDAKFAQGGHWKPHIEVSVTENFVSVLLIPLKKKIAAANLDAVKLRVAGEVIALVARTQSAYVELQSAQAMLEMRQNVEQIAAAQAETSRQLGIAGNVPQLSVDLQQAEHEQATLAVLTAAADLVAARVALAAQLGVHGDSPIRLATQLSDPPAGDPAELTLQTAAREHSPALAAARSQAIVAARQLGIAKLSPIDDAAVGAAAEREIGGSWELGPAVSLPIPLFDQGQAARAKAQAMLRQSQQSYAGTRLQLTADVATGYARLTAARAAADAYKQSVLPLRHRITREQLQQFNGMFVGVDTVLNARRAEVEASGEYIAALKDYWLARADLERTIGGRLPEPVTTQPTSRPASQ